MGVCVGVRMRVDVVVLVVAAAAAAPCIRGATTFHPPSSLTNGKRHA